MTTTHQHTLRCRRMRLGAWLWYCALAQLIATGPTFADQPGATKASASDKNPAAMHVDPHSSQASTDPPYRNPKQGQEEESNLQTVIVTAEKRAELQQNVPASIQVLTTQALEREGISQFSDYAKQVPSLTLNGSATGNSGPGQGSPIIRGVSSGSADNSATVAMYLDDVPFTSDSNFKSYDNKVVLDPDLADIDRIEILEGPQSTLYGANALGGVIRIITNQPDADMFKGGIGVDGTTVESGGSGYGLHGYLNMPIVSHAVALRVTAVDREDPGFIDNLTIGQKNVNDDSVKGARGLLLIKFSDSLETTLSAYWQDIKQPGPNLIYLNQATDQPSLASLSYASPIFQGDRIISRAFSDKLKFDMKGATLTNVASYTNSYYNYYVDYSLYASLVHAPVGDGAAGEYRVTTERYNDELRLTSAPGRFEWLLGGFYTHERDNLNLGILGTDPTGVTIVPPSKFYNILTVSIVDLYKERSLFGDLTYHFTDKLEATIGSRYSYDDQPFSILESGIFASLAEDEGTHSDSGPSYLATISFKPNSDLTLYVRSADAYRPGGTQPLTASATAAGINPNFGPDKLWNYEAGAKGTFWDGRGSLTVDAYYMDWTGIQLNAVVNHFTEVTNASSAAIKGAEASLALSPINGLNLTISGAYNHAQLTSSVPSIGAKSGDPLPYSQRLSAAVATDYVHELTGEISGLVGLTYAYHSSMNTTFQSGKTYPVPSSNELDVRAGLRWSRYTAMFRVNNLTNEYALTNAGPSTAAGAPFIGSVLVPRTYTVSLAARF